MNILAPTRNLAGFVHIISNALECSVGYRHYLYKIFFLGALLGAFWQYDLFHFVDYVDLDLILAALAIQPFMILGFAAGAFRLGPLMQAPPPPYSRVFRAIVLSLGFNSILPGRASEILKATYLYEHSGVPLRAGISGIFLERMMDILMLAILGIVAISLTLINSNIVVFIIAAIGVVAIFVFISRGSDVLQTLAMRVPWVVLRNVLSSIVANASSRLTLGVARRALFFSVAIWVIALGNVTLFLNLVGSLPIDLKGALIVFVACSLGGAIPALPAGLGTYEVAAVFALSQLGYGYDEALAIGLALHGGQIVLSLVGALVIALTERIGLTASIRRAIFYHRSGTKS